MEPWLCCEPFAVVGVLWPLADRTLRTEVKAPNRRHLGQTAWIDKERYGGCEQDVSQQPQRIRHGNGAQAGDQPDPGNERKAEWLSGG